MVYFAEVLGQIKCLAVFEDGRIGFEEDHRFGGHFVVELAGMVGVIATHTDDFHGSKIAKVKGFEGATVKNQLHFVASLEAARHFMAF
jgi:hypothetical protein